MGTLVAAFFGFIHVRNMLGAFLDGFVFMLLFVFSRKITLSILAHALMNLWAMVLCVLVHFGILQVRCGDFPVVWLIENQGAYVIAALLALAGTAVFLAGRRRGRAI